MKFLKRLVYGGLGWCAKTQDYCPQGCYGVDCGNCKKVLKAKPKDIANYYGLSLSEVGKYYVGKELDFDRLCVDLERKTKENEISPKALAALDALYFYKGKKVKLEKVIDQSVILDNGSKNYAILLTLVGKGWIAKTGTRSTGNVVFWITDKGIEKYEYVRELFDEEGISRYICEGRI